MLTFIDSLYICPENFLVDSLQATNEGLSDGMPEAWAAQYGQDLN